MSARFPILLAIAGLLACGVATADTLRPSSGHGHITRINKGVVELGLDNILLIRFGSDTTPAIGAAKETKRTTFSANFIGGPTFRYFLIDNLSLSLNVNFTAGVTSTTTDVGGTSTESEAKELGVLGGIMVDYYVRLGRGMFFKPGIGGGGYFASISTPTGQANLTRKDSRFGGLGRVQLGFVYYTSVHFNLKAAVDILFAFGKRSVEGQDEKNSEVLVDAAWNVGFAYVF